jgi:hypothetical protein
MHAHSCVSTCTHTHSHTQLVFMKIECTLLSNLLFPCFHLSFSNPIHTSMWETTRKSGISKGITRCLQEKMMCYLEPFLPGYLILAFELILQLCKIWGMEDTHTRLSTQKWALSILPHCAKASSWQLSENQYSWFINKSAVWILLWIN